MQGDKKKNITAVEQLESVLCDPEGNVVVDGSSEDRRLIKESLDEIRLLSAQGDANG